MLIEDYRAPAPEVAPERAPTFLEPDDLSPLEEPPFPADPSASQAHELLDSAAAFEVSAVYSALQPRRSQAAPVCVVALKRPNAYVGGRSTYAMSPGDLIAGNWKLPCRVRAGLITTTIPINVMEKVQLPLDLKQYECRSQSRDASPNHDNKFEFPKKTAAHSSSTPLPYEPLPWSNTSSASSPSATSSTKATLNAHRK
ncbi:hypothetical protein FIBSPDRAFT_947523 [Athelia psychrophila]|uniref:Uncharacterized protein n=1 Tax=Athelia psychrophila TaxID=1759441 RepID=A0A166RVG2_9AGAM|nr:hypothetical protein FIBSPDRAFT_947523 [Fibularhizoctonia sp. CBS 109695]